MNKRKWKNYTEKEETFLEESWGTKSLKNISKILNRTEKGIATKAKRMHLGATTKADEYLTSNQVALIMGVHRHNEVIRKWILKYGLKSIRKITLYKKRFWLIKHYNLLNWLENNTDKFDSMNINLEEFGYMPEWLKRKRIADYKSFRIIILGV